MKKLISFLALALMVSSCGNRLSIIKRHYTKGFYVQNNKAADKTTTLSERTQDVRPEKMALTNAKVLSDKNEQIKEIDASVINSANNVSEKRSSQKHELKKQTTNETISTDKKNNSNSGYSIKTVEKKSNNSKRGGSDANIVLLVILSLFPFICLIAMYLHDGNDVTLNFWICLLLHLTIVLWLVFALLVDFNIIDLA